ncbi:preprotein translocase subunit SecA [candidate division KSB3 bacterium]|uniref:Protein translocase subunit SecA n=1 Tax=candidate division KSB3 bacterium TaxID=2044937 RepID=A0A2G6E218_9BACT|nr:MAG: preprotein translocase subunit SecA [candidate division KSB3 bacterium]PIE28796.1 MAG: preprotein translocase subunit SecA [candidate division KSB3 bacterium]
MCRRLDCARCAVVVKLSQIVMFKKLLHKIITPKNERTLKEFQTLVDAINGLEAKFELYGDDELQAMTEYFRKKIIEDAVVRAKDRLNGDQRALRKHIEELFGEEEGNDFSAVGVEKHHNKVLTRILETLSQEIATAIEAMKELSQFEEADDVAIREGIEDFLRGALHEEMEKSMNDILPEAFAVVREASKRALKMRHFDVQLIGGITLHQGRIAEMKTGEGKTLVATLPVYLNALTGRGVHVVTVNDYLARRDSEWMGQIYTFLGLTVGVIQNGMSPKDRQEAYGCDITYGTNNEYGFDYLRDNLKSEPGERVQRELNYAIVDEVDSILIDEARTPLIISGEVAHDTNKFVDFRSPVRGVVDKQRTIVNDLFRHIQKYDDSDPEAYEKYELLLKVERGNPKNEQLLEYIAEHKSARKMMLQVENDYMRDKRIHELNEGLMFAISEKEHNVELTEEGQQLLSRNEADLFVLPDLDEEFSRIDSDESLGAEQKSAEKRKISALYDERHEKIHNITQLIKAYTLFKRDVDYVVADNKEVVIVDEFTGRMMPGRRYSDGLHQALEAKEGVQVAKASQTIASITLQNYFRLYHKLSGMTGTAETEAAEFMNIYKLDVVVVPTNEPLARIDHPDLIYKTENAKFRNVAREIVECYLAGQPSLVGTITIKVSEELSEMLSLKHLTKILTPEKLEELKETMKTRGAKGKIPHHVLNAKYHEKEAEIVAQAGQFGAVTIATNMAGRGTDIVLGEGVADLGGLHIIGTERHESRRIDNQLRGRSGRQGDRGSSRFYLSLEDDLMRIFGSERIAAIMERLGVDEDEPIEHSLISRTIENAQKKVEGFNFETRKQLLKYDDVNNKQREVIYTRRDHVIFSSDLQRDFFFMVEDVIYDLLDTYAPKDHYPEEWEYDGLKRALLDRFSVYQSFDSTNKEDLTQDSLFDLLKKAFQESFLQKAADFERIPDIPFQAYFGPLQEGESKINVFLRSVMLQVIDRNWMDNLQALDHLKEGINLRSYGQKDPLLEYKREAFEIFADMISRINTESVEFIMKFSVRPKDDARRTPLIMSASEQSEDSHGMAMRQGRQMQQQSVDDLATNTSEGAVEHRPVVRTQPKVGRNNPCPCGSGKKYKKCCGR